MGLKRSRRKFTASFKAKVAIEAIKEQLTLAELSKRHELHVNQISTWKKDFLANSAKVFCAATDQDSVDQERDRLLRKVGELEMERDFLKKSLDKLGA